jgi:hypothetical protein
VSGWSTVQLEGAYLATDLVDCPRYVAANLGDLSGDLVKATRNQCFDALDCLREGSNVGGFVKGVDAGVVPLNSGGELGQTPEELFKLRL